MLIDTYTAMHSKVTVDQCYRSLLLLNSAVTITSSLFWGRDHCDAILSSSPMISVQFGPAHSDDQ